MKVLKNERKDNTVSLEIEIPHSDYVTALDAELIEASKEIKVPGFRPGKAPKNIVETYVNSNVLKERALRRVFSDAYPEVIKEANIDPVDYPDIKVISEPKDDSPIVIGISVEVYPTVTLGKYKSLKVEKNSIKVEDSEVDEYINQIRENHAQFNEIGDRGAADGDILEFDLLANLNGRQVLELTKTRMGIVLGDKQYELFPGFNENLLGVKTNEEKKFTFKTPENYDNNDLAGKDIEFNALIKRAVVKQLPELNDEFAKKAANLDSVEKLKEDARKLLEDHKKNESDANVKDKLVDLASQESTVLIPQAMINKELEIMLDEFRKSLENSNITLENYLAATKKDMEKMKEEIKSPAEKRVKGKIVLRAIADAEKIEVSDPEINEEVNNLAANVGRDASGFHQGLGESGRAYIKDYMLRRKALDFLSANAKIKEKGE